MGFEKRSGLTIVVANFEEFERFANAVDDDAVAQGEGDFVDVVDEGADVAGVNLFANAFGEEVEDGSAFLASVFTDFEEENSEAPEEEEGLGVVDPAAIEEDVGYAGAFEGEQESEKEDGDSESDAKAFEEVGISMIFFGPTMAFGPAGLGRGCVFGWSFDGEFTGAGGALYGLAIVLGSDIEIGLAGRASDKHCFL